MARRAADEELSVRALEKLAQDAAPKRARTGAIAPRANTDQDAFVDRLRFKFATQVRVVQHERGGTIELRYADPSDLVRIADLLLGDST
jgi:hypothetical protein